MGGKKSVISANNTGAIELLHAGKKMNLDTDFTHSTTINSKWITDLET